MSLTCNGGPPPPKLPAPNEQTESLLAEGRRRGLLVAAQHNGLDAAGAVCPGAPFAPMAPGCPNWWAYTYGASNLPGVAYPPIIGFQTSNMKQVWNGSQLQDIFVNMYNNSNSIFLELYEEVFW